MKWDGGRRVGIINNKVGTPFFLPPFFIFIAFVLLHSCATSTPKSGQGYIIENIPFFPQTIYQCGPASLAGVMNYWGIKVTPEEIAREIYSESARGTLNIDMVLYPQRRGLKTNQYRGDMEDLRKNVKSGYPVIVLVDYGFSIYQANHYLVVIGYNDHGVIVNSGKEKRKVISEEDFVRSWGRTKFWTLLIKPR